MVYGPNMYPPLGHQSGLACFPAFAEILLVFVRDWFCYMTDSAKPELQPIDGLGGTRLQSCGKGRCRIQGRATLGTWR